MQYMKVWHRDVAENCLIYVPADAVIRKVLVFFGKGVKNV